MDQNVTQKKIWIRMLHRNTFLDQNGVLKSALIYILSVLSFNPGMITPFRRLRRFGTDDWFMNILFVLIKII